MSRKDLTSQGAAEQPWAGGFFLLKHAGFRLGSQTHCTAQSEHRDSERHDFPTTRKRPTLKTPGLPDSLVDT